MTPKYRYDQLQFSSVLPNFTNINTITNGIVCAGTIANGSGANFTATVELNEFNNFSDVYLINQNTNKKTSICNTLDITSIWQYVSTETVQDSVSYLAGIVTVEISVFNGTGGSITLTPQTYTVEIIEYQIANLAL